MNPEAAPLITGRRLGRRSAVATLALAGLLAAGLGSPVSRSTASTSWITSSRPSCPSSSQPAVQGVEEENIAAAKAGEPPPDLKIIVGSQ